MLTNSILYNKNDGVVTLTLNYPDKLNCLDDIMVQDLRAALYDAKNDDTIGAIVLTGAGRAFCAGGDIKEMMDKKYSAVSGYQHMKEYHELTLELANCNKPIIAAVNGAAAGGGFSLAMLCDIVVASTKAKFTLAFLNIALVPDLGLIFNLSKTLGSQKVKELVFFNKPIEADEALRLGLVSEVVEQEKLQEEAFQLAKQLANGPHVMIQYTKKMINMAMENNMATMLEVEARAQTQCFLTEDHKIAAKAFTQKAKPVYVGR